MRHDFGALRAACVLCGAGLLGTACKFLTEGRGHSRSRSAEGWVRRVLRMSISYQIWERGLISEQHHSVVLRSTAQQGGGEQGDRRARGCKRGKGVLECLYFVRSAQAELSLP